MITVPNHEIKCIKAWRCISCKIIYRLSICRTPYWFLVKIARGLITLINATSYDWHLSHSHQYQTDWALIVVVEAGSSKEILAFMRNSDDGAEATYSLIGHPTNASFVVQARHTDRSRIEIQFQEGWLPWKILRELRWIWGLWRMAR